MNQTMDRDALKALIKAGYRLLRASNDPLDPWPGDADHPGCGGHPGFAAEVESFVQVWEGAIRQLGLNPSDIVQHAVFDAWIDGA